MYKTEDSDLQEMYSNEDSGQLQEMHNTEDPVTHKEGTSSAMNLTDSSSVAKALAEMWISLASCSLLWEEIPF